MIKARKISAFTLTEILVVLVISTIVVGFAFAVLDMVQRNLTTIRENFEANSEIRHLEQQLSTDFNRFHSIRYDGVRKKMHLNTPIDTIIYTLTAKRLLRNQDTLSVPIKNIEVFFDGDKVTTGQVDAVKIFMDRPDKKFLFVYKINSAKNFIN